MIIFQSLFVHPTDDYDFIIRLDSKVLPRSAQNVNTEETSERKFANRTDLADTFPPVAPGFDPARMLFSDLKVGNPRLFIGNIHIAYSSLQSGYMRTLSNYSTTRWVGTSLADTGILRLSPIVHSKL